MSNATVGIMGDIALPTDVRDRYGLKPNTVVRIVETRSGILLVPLSTEPMSPELAREIADWQALGSSSWEMFPFDEAEG